MSVKGDFGRLDTLIGSLDRLADGSAVQELADALGEEALELVDEGFQRGRGPGGRRWPKPAYRSGPPLVNTGALRKSFVLRRRGNGFEIVSGLPYAHVLQHGLVPRWMVPSEAQITSRWDRALRKLASDWADRAMK